MISNLIERRVPQYLGLYVLGGWGFIQFVDWAVERYVLSPYLVEFVLLALLLLVPSVVVLSYFHGAPGRDRWTRAEKIGVPINLVLAGLVLFVVFSGRSLGAAGDTIAVRSPDGGEVEVIVPRDAFRSDIALFHFDNATGDADLDWMQYAATTALELDLAQDPFLSVISSFGTNGLTGSMDEDLRAAGFEDAVGAPLSLRRELAGERHLEHMVSGSIGGRRGALVLTSQLHETSTGRLEAEREFEGPNFLALLDQAARQLREDLGVPDASLASSPDLPLEELLTASEAALEASTRGIVAVTRGDFPGARQRFLEAVNEDPTFAVAHFQLAFSSLALNDRETADRAMNAALRHDYRLPERVKISLRAAKAAIFDEDQDQAVETARYWTQVYPSDIAAHAFLGQLLVGRNQLREAIRSLEKIIEIDPSQFAVLQTLSSLHMRLGETDEAIDYLGRYAEAFPADYQSHLNLAEAEMQTGDLDAAQASYQRALAAAPDEVDVTIGIGRLATRRGSLTQAQASFDEALDGSATPTDSASVLRAMEGLMVRQGRAVDALRLYEQRRDARIRALGVVNAVTAGGLYQAPALGLAAETGRAGYVQREIERFEGELPAPLDGVLTILAMETAVLTGDPEAPALVDRAEEAIRALGAEILVTTILDARGRLAERRGDCAAAEGAYNNLLKENPTSSLGALGLARCRLSRGRTDDVEATLAPLLRRDPSNPWAHLLLAKAAVAEGDDDAARAALEPVLATWAGADPAYEPAREARELAERLGV